jgi:hypothetical protein
MRAFGTASDKQTESGEGQDLYTLPASLPVCAVNTLSELWLQRQIQQLDDAFAIDDNGGQ